MGSLGAWVFIVGTVLTVAFHLAMIAGAPLGHLTMGGRWPGALPIRVRGLSVVSALILGGMAAVVASHAGLMALSVPDWAIWVVMGYMVLAVVAHLATPSAAERRLWLPVIVIMLLGVQAVAFAS